MFEDLAALFRTDGRIAYAMVFGSAARKAAHGHSDVDVAVGLMPRAALAPLDCGQIVSALEGLAGRPVDLVLLDEAPPGLAYRVFRDGQTIFVRDASRLTARRALAVLEYLDFIPVEQLCAKGVLEASHGR